METYTMSASFRKRRRHYIRQPSFLDLLQGYLTGDDQHMRLVQNENENVLAEQVLVADTFFLRLKGLMFTESLPPGCCLHIRPCRSVHTYFMKYKIDILYLDAWCNIVGADASARPGKMGAIYRNSVSVIELPEGIIKHCGIQIGQAVRFESKTKGER